MAILGENYFNPTDALIWLINYHVPDKLDDFYNKIFFENMILNSFSVAASCMCIRGFQITLT